MHLIMEPRNPTQLALRSKHSKYNRYDKPQECVRSECYRKGLETPKVLLTLPYLRKARPLNRACLLNRFRPLSKVSTVSKARPLRMHQRQHLEASGRNAMEDSAV